MFGLGNKEKEKIDYLYQLANGVYKNDGIIKLLETMKYNTELSLEYLKKFDFNQSTDIVERFEECLKAAQQHEIAFDQRFKQMVEKMSSLQSILNELNEFAKLINTMRNEKLELNKYNNLTTRRIDTLEEQIFKLNTDFLSKPSIELSVKEEKDDTIKKRGRPKKTKQDSGK